MKAVSWSIVAVGSVFGVLDVVTGEYWWAALQFGLAIINLLIALDSE